MQVTLTGIDPGIVDTGLVTIELDAAAFTWRVYHEVVSAPMQRNGFEVSVKPEALDRVSRFANHGDGTLRLVGIEAYRQRGYNQRQDAEMLELVRALHETVPSKIVDNTGIKKVVTEGTLKLFKCSRFPGTNHADLKSAARVALMRGLKDPNINTVIAMFMLDNLKGQPWSYI